MKLRVIVGSGDILSNSKEDRRLFQVNKVLQFSADESLLAETSYGQIVS